jgi:CubicO group peptidase (beta-lactamase class C family)
MTPGTAWRYSGGGFLILQQLLMDLTGRSFMDLTNELVFTPGGMTRSTFAQPLPAELAPSAALPYRRTGGPYLGGPRIYPELAATGLWTTPSDMARLAVEMDRAYAGRSRRIVSQAAMRQMLAVQRSNWGLGVAVTGNGHDLQFIHLGVNMGYRCVWVHFPERHQGVVIMTNSGNGGELGGEFLRAVSTVERTTTTVDPTVLRSYVGTYASATLGVTVRYENERLQLQAPPLGPQPLDLLPQSKTDFFVATDTISVHFVIDRSRAVGAMELSMGPQTFRLKRVE